MNRLTPCALTLALLSGTAALAHQIIWTRRLVDLLGASALTFSKVVGAFFVGLAVGAWLAARGVAKARGSWRVVALAEIGVTALSLPVLFSWDWSRALFESPTLADASKLLLPLLLVTPPAVAMGLVIPFMVQGLAARRGLAPSLPVWLYAVNTLGGVLGVGLVLFVGLPWLGLTRSGLAAGGLNLVVAGGAWALQRQVGFRAVPIPTERRPIEALQPRFQALAFFSGFLVLGLEVILQHQLAQVSINSLFSSGAVLALVLVSLTVAAMLAPWLSRRLDTDRALNAALMAAAALGAIQPFLFTGMRHGLNILSYELLPLQYAWELAKLGAVAVCPLLVAAGFVFPLLLRACAPADHQDAGRSVGVLLAWNGLGGWLGTEVAQTWIAPNFGLWNSVSLTAVGYLLLLTLNTNQRRGSSAIGWPVYRPLAALLLVLASAYLARSLPQTWLEPGQRLAAVQVGREGVVASIELGPGDWRMRFDNSYNLGGSKAQFDQERQAHLPLLLHGHARTVALMGAATGSTTAGAALHPELEQIDAIELSRLVLQQARRFFGPYNREVFSDPRVHWFQDDARWVIARHPRTYDVVIGDLFLPWRTGQSRLFTVEHFQAVRRSLKPDGLYCQWLPMFQLTPAQFNAIARTFRTVFPEAYLVRDDFYLEKPVLGLVGGRSLSAQDWSRTQLACAQLQRAGRVHDPLARHVEGVAMMVVGPLVDPGPGPVNTLGNAWLEWDAGRNVIGLRTPWFVGLAYAGYLDESHRAGQAMLPPDLQTAHHAAQFFQTLQVAVQTQSPDLAGLKSQIDAQMPLPLRQDPGAEWRHWPLQVKPK